MCLYDIIHVIIVMQIIVFMICFKIYCILTSCNDWNTSQFKHHCWNDYITYDIYIDIHLRCQPSYYLRVSELFSFKYTYYVHVVIHILQCKQLIINHKQSTYLKYLSMLCKNICKRMKQTNSIILMIHEKGVINSKCFST